MRVSRYARLQGRYRFALPAFLLLKGECDPRAKGGLRCPKSRFPLRAIFPLPSNQRRPTRGPEGHERPLPSATFPDRLRQGTRPFGLFT